MNAPSRRDFLTHSAGLLGTAAGLGSLAAESAIAQKPPPAAPPAPKRVAMINSIYRFRSHAYHLGRRILWGYDREGFLHQPSLKLARMFNDQYPDDDLSRTDGAGHDFEVVETVAQALGDGTAKASGLDVDAVLLVVEHGDYKTNEFDQILYPRYELFQQIVAVFEKTGRSVPVFVDKHLSYDHRKAREMFDTAKRLGFGLMAGSSLPVTWRKPELELPLETKISEGLVVFGYDRGPAEIYFFHALEALQCMLERREGGESGVEAVVGLKGDDVWQAADDGHWSWDLLDAALGRNPSLNVGDVQGIVRKPEAILIDYVDGTRGVVLNLVDAVSELSFAGALEDRIVSNWFVLPPPPGAKFFDALMWNIEKFIASGVAPYPIERTLLTSTVLDLGMRSLKADGKLQAGRVLDIRYRAPRDGGFLRGRYTRDE
jgi:hypothetical protein